MSDPDPPPPSRTEVLLDALYRAALRQRRLPVIRGEDAELVTRHVHAQIDRGTEARANVAAAGGHPLACGKGCDHCCRNAPAIFAGEAVTIARWLDRPEHAALRAGFLARYPAWFARLDDLLGAWATAAAAGDAAAAEAALTGVWRRSVMCAFNQDGACTIYEVRPTVCRSAHALDTPERCAPSAPAPPATLRFPPLDDFLLQIRPVIFAMHAALHQDGTGSQPLCVAVHDELQR